MIELIIAILIAVTGGGLTGLFYWRASRRKANGEAAQTEAEAMKSIQQVYQQALDDQQRYIVKLQDTRDHLVHDREEMRRENNELRRRLNEMDEKVRKLERDVERNKKIMESMKHLLCGRIACPNRVNVDLGSSSDDSDSEPVVTTHPNRSRKKAKR